MCQTSTVSDRGYAFRIQCHTELGTQQSSRPLELSHFLSLRKALLPGILHWDGTSWTARASGTTSYLYGGIWGSAANDVWAVGDQGIILHWDGTSWTVKPSGLTGPLLGVWGSAANDAWAVSYAGTILHWNGSSWSAKPSGTTNPLFGIWASAANDAWAVGSFGTILHWDGISWTARTSGTTAHLRGVWGRAGQVWIAGESGVILFHR